VGRRRFLGLDEAIPTLDPDLREDTQVEHTKVGQVGMTFIRVTHDREEARTMNERLTALDRGQVEWGRVATRVATRVTAIAVAALVAACSGISATPAPSLPASVGGGEGQLDLIARTGHVVGGTGGEKVEGVDWVTPFEAATGCKVTVKVAATSDEMIALMRTGTYDGVAAAGDATRRLIEAGDVAAVNLDLVPNHKAVFASLTSTPHDTVNGVHYGVPHGRGANLLAYNTDVVKPAPDSWSVVWDPNTPLAGKITDYDSPIYIADAAVYLMATRPDLGIRDPYALDEKQLAAAVDLLKAQRPNVGEYWSDATSLIDSFASGSVAAGTTWRYQVNRLLANDPAAPIATVLPNEGSTGWSETWMIASKAKHPNCMYRWMDYIISPAVNAAATVYFGEAPVSEAACEEAEKLSPGHCDAFHATDESFFSKVHFWTTPTKDCVDGRGAICTDYADWTKAWAEIRG
jgi:putative spermidine/putrescine transport system substrate-binding protein